MVSLRKRRPENDLRDQYYLASQWKLVWNKFKAHKLARAGGVILIALYTAALFCEVVATQHIDKYDTELIYAPPQRIRFFDSQGRFHFRPFVYGYRHAVDPRTYRRLYATDTGRVYPLYLLVRGDRYELWGLLKSDIHLFGVREGQIHLFGTDALGRDVYSRVVYAARISLSIGLVGVAASFVLGCLLGGVSGYFGGTADLVIQRVIEFLLSLPHIPLWMGLAAALPPDWPAIRTYFGITIILSLIGWTNLARVVRGKIMSLRREDFVAAAKIAGAGEMAIIVRHLLPGFASYLIVNLTLAVPHMILAETSLSFIGVGIQPPAVSWGTLLKDAQSIRTIADNPWLLVPALFVIVTVVAFNFLGDGLRDAADPYR